MASVFFPPRTASLLFSPPNSGINVLAIQACTNSATYNSALPASLMASIALSTRFMPARLARMRDPSRPPLGPTSSATDLIPGSRFHLDFGFMRASSNTFLKTKTGTRVVQSHDGFTSYLIIADAVTRYTQGFSYRLQRSSTCTCLQVSPGSWSKNWLPGCPSRPGR
jgi:hypothetical protein